MEWSDEENSVELETFLCQRAISKSPTATSVLPTRVPTTVTISPTENILSKNYIEKKKKTIFFV